jgi:polyisoprenoid-binding protein YceI
MAKTAAAQRAAVEAPPAGTWELDKAHTHVGFVARHLMVAKVRGRFQDFSGTIHIAEAPEDSSVDVTIQAASIHTDTGQRDDHLRSPDFLDVERFPTLTFRSTNVELTSDDTLRVTGDLTIKDVTRPVVLDVTYEGTTPDPWGGTRAGFSATTELDREDFDITWNAALETGGVVVGKKVRIELDIEASLAR